MHQLLIRLALWVRRPPSRRQLIVMAIVAALCLLIGTIEWLGLWPEAWKVDRLPRRIN